jgi:membrane fusion protein (multidrug efflux system)
VFEVQPRPFREHIAALGTLRAWESIDITTPASQLLEVVAFEDGQQVEAGQVLARLRQDAESASLRELRARLEDARREVRRLEDLARRNQVAQTDLDTARTDVEVLEHQIGEVEARVGDLTIRAPFAGVLGLREVSAGALVAVGQRLTTLDDISRMRLQFTVPERFLGALRLGQEITATTAAWAGTFTGTLTAIDSRIDATARSIAARAVLANDAGRLRPGMLMEVSIRGEERQALMIPEESLESRGARHFVWRLDGERALRSEVEIGARTPGWVVVRQGLEAGQMIVRDGLIRLSGTSMPVRVVTG